jgi:glucosamine 6-phosphate synthetase-like amidotransferase/phosphosugar isomerase protein
VVTPDIQELMNLEQIEKGGYDHFMLKEIYEQPSVIKDTYRGRLHANEGLIQMSGVEDNLEKFLNADRIIIVAWHIMACWVRLNMKSFREYLLKWNMLQNLDIETR